jgi:hypothetical protein
MRLESIKGLASAGVAAGFLFYTVAASSSFGDEPGLFGRLFRMGNANSGSSPTPGPATSSSASMTPAPSYLGQPALSTPPSTLPGSPSSAVAPRVSPKPRVNKPITEADPLVTRISLGRSDNGGQFGMLLQVYADGTIIDGEGVHRVSPEALKPVFDAVSSGELAKLKGHCGGPAGDFIENVHVVVFERSLGRLRANSFSYSGNPQGCEHAVIHLQKALDELQNKLSPMAPTVAPSVAPTANHVSSPPLPLTNP